MTTRSSKTSADKGVILGERRDGLGIDRTVVNGELSSGDWGALYIFAPSSKSRGSRRRMGRLIWSTKTVFGGSFNMTSLKEAFTVEIEQGRAKAKQGELDEAFCHFERAHILEVPHSHETPGGY